MLVHVQLPGATFVAPAHRWLHDYGRLVRTGARPLVILQPMGPVMFVFDVSDTESTADAPHLPPTVERPFEVESSPGKTLRLLESLVENAKRDGVRVIFGPGGSQSAGMVRVVDDQVAATQAVYAGKDKRTLEPKYEYIRVRYDLQVNDGLSPAAKFATIAHELAHLYCGHPGSPNLDHWPDRRGLDQVPGEFEAESVSFLVCGRAGLEPPSASYLGIYIGQHEDVPAISLDCVLKAAGLIETMSRQRLAPRKTRSKPQAE